MSHRSKKARKQRRKLGTGASRSCGDAPTTDNTSPGFSGWHYLVEVSVSVKESLQRLFDDNWRYSQRQRVITWLADRFPAQGIEAGSMDIDYVFPREGPQTVAGEEEWGE